MNTTNTKPFNQAQAVRLIGNTCKKFDISLKDLRKAFPQRPTTEADFMRIAEWMNTVWEARTGKSDAAPSQPASPQALLAEAQANWARKDKNGKAMPMYFAVQMDGKPHFFKVKPGYKVGVWFVEEQASDELYPVNSRERRGRILGLIFQDSAKAQAMYGELIGKCARCQRTLTDHTNPYFSMGLGPECGGK